jgi:hypothetical protein
MKPHPKKRARIIFLSVVILLIIVSFTQIDFSDLSWANNRGWYKPIIVLFIIGFGTVYSLITAKE